MNSRLQFAIAAALAAGTVSLATAQQPQETQQPPQQQQQPAQDAQPQAQQPQAQPQPETQAQPPAQPSAPQPPAAAATEGRIPRDLADLTFVQEPIASASRVEGPDGELGKQVVEAINADPSFKGSKITVQPEEGKVTLTGSAMTRAQVKRAGTIAAEKVGGVQNVVNAIQDADPMPSAPQAEAQVAQAGQAAPAGQDGQAAQPGQPAPAEGTSPAPAK